MKFRRFFRNIAEKVLGRYNEGADPPERLATMVDAFAEMNPHATRAEWIAFAVMHAGEAYRSGYMRGVEYVERDEKLWRPDVSPEAIADMIDPDWKWSPAIDLTRSPDEIIPEEYADARLVREDLDEVAGRHRGEHDRR